MSVASLLAVAVYLLVIAACLSACSLGPGRRARSADRRHWLAAAARLAGTEDHLRGALREAVAATGHYGERAIWQLPIAVLLVLLARCWRRLPPGSRWRLVLASRAGLLLLAGLILLRLLSFHQTDRLLSSGPVRLN